MFFAALSCMVCACSSESRTETESKAGKPESEKVTWKKTELTKPEGVSYVQSLSFLEDGTLRICAADQDYGNQGVWDSKDQGNTWKKADADTSLESEYGYHYSPEGKLYVYDENRLDITTGGDSETLNAEDGEVFVSASVSGGTLAVLVQNQENDQLRAELYDLQSMESRQLDNEELSEYLSASAAAGGRITLDRSGEILYLAGAGVARYDIKQDKFTYLQKEDELNSFIDMQESILTSFAAEDDGKKLVLCVDNPEKNQSELYLCEKGTWEAEKTAAEDRLRIYSLKDGSMRQAASLFQEKCPELEVTFEVGYTGEDGVTLSDAIRNLNTELMAGEGPDILIMDGLPADSYIEKGILEDVSDLVELKKDELFYNIISAYNSGKNIYQVPTAFQVPVLLGDKETADAKDSDALMRILEEKAQSGKPLLTTGNLANLAGSLFITSGIMEKTVDEEKLTEFYRTLKTVAEGSFSEEERNSMEDWQKLSYWAQQYPLTSDLALDLYFDRAQTGTDIIFGYDNYTELLSACKEKGLTCQYLNQDGGNYFIATNILGISRAGKHLKEAKEFLEFYLSGEMQSTEKSGMLSTVRAGIDNTKYVSEDGELLGTVSRKDTPDEEMNVYKLTYAEEEEFIAFLEKGDTPVKDDAVVLEKVMEQADACLFDGKSPEDAAKDACSEVNLYLSE